MARPERPATPGRRRTRLLKAAFVFVLAFPTLFFLWDEWAGGAFDRLVLFSEVHGTVLKDGKPVAGAELVQRAVWSANDDENPQQRTTTDATGAFRFAPIERAAWLQRLMLGQPWVNQEITIRYQGVEYPAWTFGKGDYDPGTELDGRPLKLVCDLADKPEIEGKHYGVCRVW
jgi:hypothetical protein